MCRREYCGRTAYGGKRYELMAQFSGTQSQYFEWQLYPYRNRLLSDKQRIWHLLDTMLYRLIRMKCGRIERKQETGDAADTTLPLFLCAGDFIK